MKYYVLNILLYTFIILLVQFTMHYYVLNIVLYYANIVYCQESTSNVLMLKDEC